MWHRAAPFQPKSSSRSSHRSGDASLLMTMAKHSTDPTEKRVRGKETSICHNPDSLPRSAGRKRKSESHSWVERACQLNEVTWICRWRFRERATFCCARRYVRTRQTMSTRKRPPACPKRRINPSLRRRACHKAILLPCTDTIATAKGRRPTDVGRMPWVRSVRRATWTRHVWRTVPAKTSDQHRGSQRAASHERLTNETTNWLAMPRVIAEITGLAN